MVVPATPAGVGFVQGNYFAVQSSSAPSTMQTVTIPYPVPQQQGGLNVIVIGWRDTKYQVQSVTDTSANTYSVAAPMLSLSGFGRQVIYYAKNIFPGSANSVTVTFTGAAHLPDIRISEYKSLATTTPLDVTHGSTATSGRLSDSGFATTTNAYDVLVGANLVDSSIQTTAAGANYTSQVITTPRADIYEDRLVTAIGSYNATAPTNKSGNWIAQMVAFKEAPNQAPVVNAGPNQTITLPTNTVTLNGTATDDGLPTNTLTISWSQVSGPGTVTFSNPNTAITQATFPGVGTYVLQLTANDSQLNSSATTRVTVNPHVVAVSLRLNPTVAGPDVVGTSQTLTASVTQAGTALSGVSLRFTVTGPNAITGSATTDATGAAKFTYAGSLSGNDTVQASYAGQNSNTASVSWLIPAQPASTSPVYCRFFSSGFRPIEFNTAPTVTPVFTQTFPSINFNPAPGLIPGQPADINQGTRPFTDVVTDSNGNFAGSIVAQGDGYQAGGYPLIEFQMVCTGTLTIKSAGPVTFHITDDDGMFFGVGGGATLPTNSTNPMINPPASGLTPFSGFPVMGSYNSRTLNRSGRLHHQLSGSGKLSV